MPKRISKLVVLFEVASRSYFLVWQLSGGMNQKKARSSHLKGEQSELNTV